MVLTDEGEVDVVYRLKRELWSFGGSSEDKSWTTYFTGSEDEARQLIEEKNGEDQIFEYAIHGEEPW